MANQRKDICVSILTGKVNKETKQAESFTVRVGSAFVDEKSGRINGTFNTLPLNWDGKFVMFDAKPRDNPPAQPSDYDDSQP